LATPHGVVETPGFIFCGTKAAMKGVMPHQMRAARTQIVLANTYHLMVNPGAELIARMGGLHAFTGWDGPMLTDSGGFQIFSMQHNGVTDEIKGRNRPDRVASLIRIEEDGAAFRSYHDGSTLFLSPEASIQIQRDLGPDIILTLDECTPFHADRAYTTKSLARSHRWQDRSLKEFQRTNDGKQALYGIVSGGVYEDLRHESAAYTADRPYFGTAIGDSLGGSKAQMYDVVQMAQEKSDRTRPVHLLGIGGVDDIFANIRAGIDTFDCVSPTRMARHGSALIPGVPGLKYNIRNSRFKESRETLPLTHSFPGAERFTLGYIHHLFSVGEMLGIQILSWHNVAFMNTLMEDVRAAIRTGTIAECERKWLG
jgi:queuine tRNA-ribosyltransferase